jgi:hypothetical protein
MHHLLEFTNSVSGRDTSYVELARIVILAADIAFMDMLRV